MRGHACASVSALDRRRPPSLPSAPSRCARCAAVRAQEARQASVRPEVPGLQGECCCCWSRGWRCLCTRQLLERSLARLLFCGKRSTRPPLTRACLRSCPVSAGVRRQGVEMQEVRGGPPQEGRQGKLNEPSRAEPCMIDPRAARGTLELASAAAQADRSARIACPLARAVVRGEERGRPARPVSAASAGCRPPITHPSLSSVLLSPASLRPALFAFPCHSSRCLAPPLLSLPPSLPLATRNAESPPSSLR